MLLRSASGLDAFAWPGLLLAALLLFAAWRDLKTRRIPNALVLTGLVCALTMQALLPRGASLFAAEPGSIGVLASLGGCALGLLLLLPLYALGLLGAGDVKLMAMVGAWLGPAQVAGAILLTMLAGGVLALVFALGHGALGQALANTRDIVLRMLVLGVRSAGEPLAAPAATGKLPYALAIAAGTASQLYLAGSPAWKLFS